MDMPLAFAGSQLQWLVRPGGRIDSIHYSDPLHIDPVHVNPIEFLWGASHNSNRNRQWPNLRHPSDCIIGVTPGFYRAMRITEDAMVKPMLIKGMPTPGQSSPVILNNPVGGSDSFYIEWGGNVGLQNLVILGDDRAGIKTENPYSTRWAMRHPGFGQLWFHKVKVMGEWDPIAGYRGRRSKWLWHSYGTESAIFLGCAFIGANDEHCMYFHNLIGDHVWRNCVFRWAMRTAIQIVNRSHEGPVGTGTFHIDNCRVEDVCLEDGGGGSAITHRGRHHGRFQLTNNNIMLGANPDLPAELGENITGCLVVDCGSGTEADYGTAWEYQEDCDTDEVTWADTEGIGTDEVVLQGNLFQVGPHYTGKGSARRANVAMSNIGHLMILENNHFHRIEEGGSTRPSLQLNLASIQRLTIKNQGNDNIGFIQVDGNKYERWADMVVALQDDPRVTILR